MTITVEDGTNVVDANSYVSVAELEQYALERGMLLPDTDEAKEALLFKAMDYIEIRERMFKGVRAYDSQSLAWPRTEYGMQSGIPKELKKAQLVLAMAAMNTELLPVTSGVTSTAKKKTVGPISIEYATSGGPSLPSIPQAETLLKYVYGEGMFGQLKVVRA